MINLKDDVCHKPGEAVISNYLQFALDDAGEEHQEDMNTIDYGNIRINTFVTENE